jgi:hypothetical protein
MSDKETLSVDEQEMATNMFAVFSQLRVFFPDQKDNLEQFNKEPCTKKHAFHLQTQGKLLDDEEELFIESLQNPNTLVVKDTADIRRAVVYYKRVLRNDNKDQVRRMIVAAINRQFSANKTLPQALPPLFSQGGANETISQDTARMFKYLENCLTVFYDNKEACI